MALQKVRAKTLNAVEKHGKDTPAKGQLIRCNLQKLATVVFVRVVVYAAAAGCHSNIIRNNLPQMRVGHV